VIGDARLSLARESGPPYGLLVLDAFSSDAIPMHLITREALDVYLSRVAHDGVLAFHVSNRHVSLGPVLARLAANARLTAVEQSHNVTAQQAQSGRSSSQWVVMARHRATLEPLLGDSRWTPLLPEDPVPLWTDDFSNILGAMKF
jgi:hypothetical protein